MIIAFRDWLADHITLWLLEREISRAEKRGKALGAAVAAIAREAMRKPYKPEPLPAWYLQGLVNANPYMHSGFCQQSALQSSYTTELMRQYLRPGGIIRVYPNRGLLDLF